MPSFKTANVRGLTLLELMITVSIMAIISAIALPTYQNYIQSTYFDQAVLDAKEINRGD